MQESKDLDILKNDLYEFKKILTNKISARREKLVKGNCSDEEITLLAELIELKNRFEKITEDFFADGVSTIINNSSDCSVEDNLELFEQSENNENNEVKHCYNGEKYTLHYAICKVLEENPSGLSAKELADEIARQGLYRKKDGSSANYHQIYARISHHKDTFKVENRIITLR